MRPRKELLLLGRDEIECGRWRFVLETRGFRVTASSYLVETLELLSMMPEARVLLTTVPGALGADALAQCSRLPVVLFDVAQCPAQTGAALVILGTGDIAERLIHAVKNACVGKRGPRRPDNRPLPAITPLQLCRQLAIERDGVPA